MMARYLDGETVPVKTKADRLKLIGKRIQYLRPSDIDRSGRGFFFPRTGTVTGSEGRNFILDDGDALYAPDAPDRLALAQAAYDAAFIRYHTTRSHRAKVALERACIERVAAFNEVCCA